MEKKDIFINIGFIIAILICVVIIYIIGFKPILDKDELRKEECKKLGISDCRSGVVECYNDCKKLGLDYFKWDDRRFSSNECWCKINNETKQIW